MRAVKEREEDVSRLSYVLVVSVALQDAEMAAFNLFTDIWRNVFKGKVKEPRIEEIISDYRHFEGATIKYGKIGDKDIYSAEVIFNRQKAIITTRISDPTVELIRTDLNGKDVVYLTCDGKEIIRKV